MAGVILTPPEDRIAKCRCRMKEWRACRLPELTRGRDAKPSRRAELIEHSREVAAGIRERSNPLHVIEDPRPRLPGSDAVAGSLERRHHRRGARRIPTA